MPMQQSRKKKAAKNKANAAHSRRYQNTQRTTCYAMHGAQQGKEPKAADPAFEFPRPQSDWETMGSTEAPPTKHQDGLPVVQGEHKT